MATNELLPFANGDTPNVIDFASWNALAARLTGFQSGIASSQQFNRILAQGGAAGYVLGQMVANFAQQDATIDAETLYTNFLNALKSFVGTFDFDELPESWLDALMPAGEFVICAGTTLPPRTLLCNGAAVSRTTYSRLFTAIGTKYGAGDGSTTFNLPNLDGRVLQGTSDTSKVGQYLEASLPNIIGHTNIVGYAAPDLVVGDEAFSFCARWTSTFQLIPNSTNSASITFNANTGNSIYQDGNTVRSPSLTAMVCIRF